PYRLPAEGEEGPERRAGRRDGNRSGTKSLQSTRPRSLPTPPLAPHARRRWETGAPAAPTARSTRSGVRRTIVLLACSVARRPAPRSGGCAGNGVDDVGADGVLAPEFEARELSGTQQPPQGRLRVGGVPA